MDNTNRPILLGAIVLFSFSGIAQTQPYRSVMKTSWYGPGYHGNKTASGLVFNQYDPHMAAHRTLPFGTKLWLRNPTTGRSTWVVVVDRGPFIRGRALDVSARAASILGFRRKGVQELQVSSLGRMPDYRRFFRPTNGPVTSVAMLP